MAASVHEDRGQGPGVVLLHGVGVGPGSFAPLAEALCDRHRVVVLERPGAPGEAADLAAHADRIAEVVAARLGVGARLVGVSGGATLGLVLAERHPDLFGSYVLHEPLLGRLAPALHHRFQLAAASAADGPDPAMEVVAAVMGPDTWRALGSEGRADAHRHAQRWREEIAMFATFDPTPDSLLRLGRRPVLTTVGGRSAPERVVVADVLAELAGAEVRTVAGAGNAVQLDAPRAFATIVADWSPEPVGAP
ncbi:MAG: alpha/beta hydrolase [Acidimicrobiales bacterium]|nr:alpha/beta hydrolase [Acidimicrobiales bacterium]HRW38016.1 alpha/beta hydrolase [Aquihabitans sp.]